MRVVALPAEGQGGEYVLAVARVLLAAGSLVAIRLGLLAPPMRDLAASLSAAYLLYSSAILLWVRTGSNPGPALLPFGLQGVDVLWTALLPLWTGHPEVLFSAFFLFTLVAAAYRWGFWRTLATVGSVTVLLLLAAVLSARGWPAGWLRTGGGVLPDSLAARTVGWILMGCLLGYFGESQKLLRERALVIRRLSGRPDAEVGTRGTLEQILRATLELFNARRAALALQNEMTQRAYLWQATRGSNREKASLQFSELNPSERERYLFAAPEHSWCTVQPRGEHGDPPRVLMLDRWGRHRPEVRWVWPVDSLPGEGCRSHFAVSLRVGEQWSGRLFLLDPGGGSDREAELRFLQLLVREVGPAVYSARALRHLRDQAAETERARLANELHDGVIQTLAAAELRIEVLRRPGTAASVAAEEMAHIQQILHNEALNLRGLLRRLKSPGLDPGRLMDSLVEIVDGFRRETGISASFVSECQEVSLPPVVCREVTQIVREALVNVRKHSGARNVVVRLGPENGHWKLRIDDDGRGFDFSGRRSQAELDALRQGPAVIKERVRLIRGELTVESKPGRGSRLEITVPQGAY
jgi:signal transduction histidine kinase